MSLELEMPAPAVAALDAERTILGAILLRDDAYAEAVSEVAAEDFYLEAHRRVFRRMAAMWEENKPIDLVTLPHEMRDRGELDAIGGIAWLASLTEGLPRRLAIGSYCRMVREKSRIRSVIRSCEMATNRANSGDKALDVISDLQDGLEGAVASEDDDASVAAYSVAALDRFQQERKLERPLGITYGVKNLDDFSGGMRPGEVTVVGARSGVGKTSLMCQATAANCRAGVPVVNFSLEMTREQILRRLWSIESRVPYKRITDPWLSGHEDAIRVREAALRVAEWPLRIYDKEDLTLGKIVALAKVCMRRHKTRLICVDYAQEIEAPGKDERSKVMLVCRRLSQMVKHEDCSLMLLSQLVKAHREAYGKPPVVGDLIESGKLENVAHLVLLLHRGWDEERRRIGDEAELIIPKQRRGETGVLRASFNRLYATFEGE